MLYRAVWGDSDCINGRDCRQTELRAKVTAQCCNKDRVISAKFSRHFHEILWKNKFFKGRHKRSVLLSDAWLDISIRLHFLAGFSVVFPRRPCLIMLIFLRWDMCVLWAGLCLFSLQGGGIGSVWPMIPQVLCGTETNSPSLWAQWSRRRTGTSTWPCGV